MVLTLVLLAENHKKLRVVLAAEHVKVGTIMRAAAYIVVLLVVPIIQILRLRIADHALLEVIGFQNHQIPMAATVLEGQILEVHPQVLQQAADLDIIGMEVIVHLTVKHNLNLQNQLLPHKKLLHLLHLRRNLMIDFQPVTKVY